MNRFFEMMFVNTRMQNDVKQSIEGDICMSKTCILEPFKDGLTK